MVDPIENALDNLGPSLSSDLTAVLAERLKISLVAARKRLSRARGNVRRLAGIPFPRNARFMYLEKQFGSPDYWHRLAATLMANRSALGYAIAALRQNGGMVPARQFPIISGSPVRQLRHLAAETVLQRLTQVGLIKTVAVPDVGECVALVQDVEFYNIGTAELRARLITEQILLFAVRDWLRNLGIASYNLISTRADQKLPQVGTFLWDLSAPSYLGAVVRFTRNGEPKPGFVVCDVNLASSITLDGAKPFIHKCTTLRALRNVGPCMQILVANRFQREALVALRSAGVVAATPKSLFGQDIADALRELTSVLTNAAYSTFDSEKFNRVFRVLDKISGAANQLRGALFEYMIADIVRCTKTGEVMMNHTVTTLDKRKAEIDVINIQQNQRVLAIECKGYSPNAIIPDDVFKHWLHRNVPTAYDYVRQHPEWKNLPVHFEFWTSASISDEMLVLFENAKATIKPHRYTIDLRGPKDVWEACVDTCKNGLIDAYRNHFTLGDGSMPPSARSRPSAPAVVTIEDDWDDL